MFITEKLKSQFNIAKDYITNLIKWLTLSALIGLAAGFSGIVFHYAVDYGSSLRSAHSSIIFLLPIAGLAIVFLYHICNMDDDKGTNTVLTAVSTGGKIPAALAPVILISTALTHLCGGSAGREGAALQIGGSIGSLFAQGLKLKNYDSSVLIMCGMSGVFSAVFGTPITAAVFALEVVSVGVMHYGALLPSLISAIAAKAIASQFGVHSTHFSLNYIPELNIINLSKVIILALLTAVLSIVFISVMHDCSKLLAKYINNKYLRAVIGAIVIIALTFAVGSYDYNGAGMDIITKAVEDGVAAPSAFILKLLFTAITLSAGFKGGEIVPTFFIGSTFGVFISQFIAIEPSFAAAVGLVALFCGVVNCPVASILLSIEIFGAEGIQYFAVAVAVSYFFSGNCSLYSSQKIIFSKLKALIRENNQ